MVPADSPAPLKWFDKLTTSGKENHPSAHPELVEGRERRDARDCQLKWFDKLTLSERKGGLLIPASRAGQALCAVEWRERAGSPICA